MSHLHIPDGILPPILWIWGLILTGVLLLLSSRAARRDGQRQVAFQSALGGIMLAVMAIPVPIAAFDYCMTLAGPVGVLLGAAPAFQVAFVVTLILALLGQGGFTVIGLNTLVLGLGATLARPIYLRAVRRLGPPRAMALATAVSQLFSTVCWCALLVLSVRLTPNGVPNHEVEHTLIEVWHRVGAAVVIPLLLVAVALEALLGYGLAHFLERVRPDLLPRPATVPVAGSLAAGSAPGAPRVP
jgi:cobalt/nickel transport system permease protein